MYCVFLTIKNQLFTYYSTKVLIDKQVLQKLYCMNNVQFKTNP